MRKGKRFLAVILLPALLLTLVVSQAFAAGVPVTEEVKLELEIKVLGIIKELELTQKQAENLLDILRDLQDEMDGLREKRLAFLELWKKGLLEEDEDMIETARDGLKGLQESHKEIQESYHEKIEALLTAEQKEKIRERLTERWQKAYSDHMKRLQKGLLEINERQGALKERGKNLSGPDARRLERRLNFLEKAEEKIGSRILELSKNPQSFGPFKGPGFNRGGKGFGFPLFGGLMMKPEFVDLLEELINEVYPEN